MLMAKPFLIGHNIFVALFAVTFIFSIFGSVQYAKAREGGAPHKIGKNISKKVGPRTITKCQTIKNPGAYVVGRNLTAKGDCLVITTDSVTIDLGGWVLKGDGTGSGLRVEGPSPGTPAKDIVVRNGMVKEFETGIDFEVSRGAIFKNVTALDNVGVGVIAGNSTIISHCIFLSNGDDGLTCNAGCLISNIVAEGNGGDGIQTGGETLLMNNLSVGNGDGGIDAIGANNTVTGNTVRSNTGDGIKVTCPTNVIGNLATGSGGNNLQLNLAGCNVDNNVAP